MRVSNKGIKQLLPWNNLETLLDWRTQSVLTNKGRLPRRIVLKSLALGITSLAFIVIGVAFAQSGDFKIFWISESLDDGRFTVNEYDLIATRTIEFSDLEFDQDLIESYDPLGSIYWSEDALKTGFLRKGLARLKDETGAPDELLSAQNAAKDDNLGTWYASPVPTPTSVPTQRPTPTTTKTPSPSTANTPMPSVTPISTQVPDPALFDNIAQRMSAIQWSQVGKFFVGLIGLFGGYELLMLIIGWSRRHRVTLIIGGDVSVGKTWLWERLRDPDISLSELQMRGPSTGASKPAPGATLFMGRFELVPRYVDLAGIDIGGQAEWYLGNSRERFLRRLLIRQKRVLMLVLATTMEKSAERTSPDREKINLRYIDRQWGKLDLPLGIIAAKSIPNPDAVILCLNKFDLFSATEPKDSASTGAVAELTHVFEDHITRVQDFCKKNNVPFQLIFTSPKLGWGNSDIERAIKHALYAK